MLQIGWFETSRSKRKLRSLRFGPQLVTSRKASGTVGHNAWHGKHSTHTLILTQEQTRTYIYIRIHTHTEAETQFREKETER